MRRRTARRWRRFWGCLTVSTSGMLGLSPLCPARAPRHSYTERLLGRTCVFVPPMEYLNRFSNPVKLSIT